MKFVAQGREISVSAQPALSLEVEAVTQAAAGRLSTGPVVAATLAPLLGFLTLLITHHLSRLSSGLDKLVHSYGHWIPGSVGSGPDGSIGSYAGKETLALAVWGLSWLLLHYVWRRQNISLRRWLPLFVGGLMLVMVGFFHPLADPVVLGLAALFGLV